MFSAAARIERVELIGGQSALVIDNALADAQAWVRFAAQHQAQFLQGAQYAYPGLELRMPAAVEAAFDDLFRQHLRRHFDAKTVISRMVRMSMSTLQPQQLAPTQWLPHRDDSHLPLSECMIASVLYLFDQPALGGTAFYKSRLNDADLHQLMADSNQLAPADFSAKHGVHAGYCTASNAQFELLRVIEPQFNRLVVYDGSTFHSAHITAPELLNAEPATGRLTMNGFIRCRRRAV
jgi:Family of unknown function (DUF6445)